MPIIASLKDGALLNVFEGDHLLIDPNWPGLTTEETEQWIRLRNADLHWLLMTRGAIRRRPRPGDKARHPFQRGWLKAKEQAGGAKWRPASAWEAAHDKHILPAARALTAGGLDVPRSRPCFCDCGDVSCSQPKRLFRRFLDSCGCDVADKVADCIEAHQASGKERKSVVYGGERVVLNAYPDGLALEPTHGFEQTGTVVAESGVTFRRGNAVPL